MNNDEFLNLVYEIQQANEQLDLGKSSLSWLGVPDGQLVSGEWQSWTLFGMVRWLEENVPGLHDQIREAREKWSQQP